MATWLNFSTWPHRGKAAAGALLVSALVVVIVVMIVLWTGGDPRREGARSASGEDRDLPAATVGAGGEAGGEEVPSGAPDEPAKEDLRHAGPDEGAAAPEDAGEEGSAPRLVIAGRVVDEESGAPVAGARVASVTGAVGDLLSGAHEEHHFVETGGDGRFELADPAPSRLESEVLYFVNAEAGGYVLRSKMYNPDVGERRIEVKIELGRGVEVFGRVVDGDDAPVAGARVTAMRLEELSLEPGLVGAEMSRSLASTMSDGHGRFRFSAPEEGGVISELRAEKEGYIPATEVPYERGEHRLVLTTGGGALDGVVRWRDGRPAAGAEVTALVNMEGQRGLPIIRTLTADGQGRFRVENLPERRTSGGVRAEAVSGSGRKVASGQVSFTLSPDGRGTVEVVLLDEALVRGRAVDAESGRGVPGVRVSNLPYRQEAGVHPREEARLDRVELLTGPNGDFEIPVVPLAGAYYVFHEPPEGWLDEQATTAGRLPVADVSRAVEIPLEKGRVYHGRVVTADANTGVGQARVTIATRAGQTTATETGEDGRFRFTALEGRTVELLADAREGTARRDVTLDREAEEGEVLLRLSGVAELSGKVLSPSGEEIPGVHIRLSRQGLRGEEEAASVRADGRGYYYFEDVPAATALSLRATPPAESGWSRGGIREIQLEAGEYRRDADVILEPVGSLEVFVYTTEEEPVEGARVRIVKGSREGMAARIETETAATDGNGHAHFPRIDREARITVHVEAGGYSPAFRAVEHDETTVRFFLEPNRDVVIEVVEGESGQPVPSYDYIVEPQFSLDGTTPSPRRSGEVRGAGDGRTTLAGIAPGRYRVSIDAGALSARETFRMEAGGDEEQRQWRLEAGLAATIRARTVEAESGAPLAGLAVSLHEGNSPNIWNRLESATTNEDGRVAFESLAAGDYSLAVDSERWTLPEPGRVAITTEDPSPAEVLLTMENPGGVAVTLIGWQGAPETRASLRVGGLTTAGQGPVDFEHLGEGLYEGQVRTPGTHWLAINVDGYLINHTLRVEDPSLRVEETVDLGEYTRVEATVRYNDAPWQADPHQFTVRPTDGEGNIQGGENYQMTNAGPGRGRLAARPGPVILQRNLFGEGNIDFGLWTIPAAAEPVTMEFILHTERIDLGIVFPGGEPFHDGTATLFRAGEGREIARQRMTTEAARLTIGHRGAVVARFASSDGQWHGETGPIDVGPGTGNVVLVDVFPAEGEQ